MYCLRQICSRLAANLRLSDKFTGKLLNLFDNHSIIFAALCKLLNSARKFQKIYTFYTFSTSLKLSITIKLLCVFSKKI